MSDMVSFSITPDQENGTVSCTLQLNVVNANISAVDENTGVVSYGNVDKTDLELISKAIDGALLQWTDYEEQLVSDQINSEIDVIIGKYGKEVVARSIANAKIMEGI